MVSARLRRPELVNQLIGRHHYIRVKCKDREQRPLLDAAERNASPVDNNVERTKQPELHECLPPGQDQLTTTEAACKEAFRTRLQRFASQYQ